MDIVVSNIDATPQLLENVGGNQSNWLELKLIGTTSNRGAIGAKVKVTAGDLIQFDHVRAGGSFISSNDPRLHFGLANHALVDSIQIDWPSGKQDQITGAKANQILTIHENSGTK